MITDTKIIIAYFKGRTEGIAFPIQSYYTLICDSLVEKIINSATKEIMYVKQ